MIQVIIHLEKTTSLFKNLKRRGFLEDFNEAVFVWMKQKPAIGELTTIDSYCVNDEEFKTYLQNRNKPIMLRITDLSYHHMILRTDKNGIDIIDLKCYEDSTVNWI